MLLNNYTRSDVLAYAADEWQLSTRSANRLIAVTRLAIQDNSSIERSRGSPEKLA